MVEVTVTGYALCRYCAYQIVPMVHHNQVLLWAHKHDGSVFCSHGWYVTPHYVFAYLIEPPKKPKRRWLKSKS